MVKPTPAVFSQLFGNMNVVVKNKMNDENGRILILEVMIDDIEYLLVNIYNANTEQEQPKTLKNLSDMLENFEIAGDFNLVSLLGILISF